MARFERTRPLSKMATFFQRSSTCLLSSLSPFPFLSLTAPFPSLIAHAPPLRSQLFLYNSIFRALDRSQLDVPEVRQSFATILQLCLDSRPKVRKRTANLVSDVLSNAPSPPLRHPYAERVAEWLQTSLQQASSGLFSNSKTTGKGSNPPDAAIHLLALLRPVLPDLPLDVSFVLLSKATADYVSGYPTNHFCPFDPS